MPGRGNSKGKWRRFKPRQGRNTKKQKNKYRRQFDGEWDEENVREVIRCGKEHDYMKQRILNNPQLRKWWFLYD